MEVSGHLHGRFTPEEKKSPLPTG